MEVVENGVAARERVILDVGRQERVEAGAFNLASSGVASHPVGEGKAARGQGATRRTMPARRG